METLNIDDWKVVITSCEVQAPAGHLAAANLDIEPIRSLMPYVQEAAVRHFKDAISSIEETTQKTVRVTFTLRAMESEHMIAIISALFKQTVSSYAERQQSRSRSGHLSSKGLVRSGPNLHHENKGNPFTNVPPRVRRQR